MMLQRVSKEGKSTAVLNGPQVGTEDTEIESNEQSNVNHVIKTETHCTRDRSCAFSEQAESLPDCSSRQLNFPGSDTSSQLERLSVSYSIDSSATSDSGVACVESGDGTDISDDLKQSLKRQGLTVDDLLEEIPDFAVEWKSIRDVTQCSSCSAPIDFLSRKVRVGFCGLYLTVHLVLENLVVESHGTSDLCANNDT